jgi:predicted phosphodiesterase
MAAALIRIFSDIHFGDRSSQVHSLAQLRPLADGATTIILNGDTVDTRPSPDPDFSARCRAEVTDFFAHFGPPVQLVTGNHDPDISADHAVDLAGGQVFVIHGDLVFDEMVPWAADAAVIGERVRRRLGPAADRGPLEAQLTAFRAVAATIPQRHQSERNGWKYLAGLAQDVVWPPWRVTRIARAWWVYPGRIRALAQIHRPAVRFVLTGHTHLPGIWRRAGGPVVINTGSYCLPIGGYAADLTASALTIRRVRRKAGEFRIGEVIAQFPLSA